MSDSENSYGRLTVSLVNARFKAYHGLFPQEQIVGNEFRVDIDIEYDALYPLTDDNFQHLISYVDLFEIAADQMKRPRKLLESVADGIRHDLLKKFPQNIHGQIRIEKINPPITGLTGSCAVSLKF